MPLILVPRSQFEKPNVQNNYNITIGDNSRINAIGSENVTDNSSNTFNQITPELFEHIRSLIKQTNSDYRQDLLDVLTKIENAKNSGDKKECGNWFGKFFSLASIADCITVAQPLVAILSWLFA